MSGLRQQRGFTLTELMIAVAMVGILAAIALPSYERYREKTVRAEGKRCIADLQRKQEGFFIRNNTYTLDLTELGMDADCTVDGDSAYTLSVEDPGDGLGCCYKLVADPVTKQEDDGQLVLTYDARETDPNLRTVRQRLVGGSDEGWN